MWANNGITNHRQDRECRRPSNNTVVVALVGEDDPTMIVRLCSRSTLVVAPLVCRGGSGTDGRLPTLAIDLQHQNLSIVNAPAASSIMSAPRQWAKLPPSARNGNARCELG